MKKIGINVHSLKAERGIRENTPFFFNGFLRLIVLIMLFMNWTISSAQRITLHNDGYEVLYDCYLKIPIQVSWSVHKSQLGKLTRKSGGSFRTDTRCPKPRAVSSDYTKTGYQRGHMCPSADWSASARLMKDTYLMSNITPQAPKLNMGAIKDSEEKCRSIAKTGKVVHVTIKALFLNPDTMFIGKHRVAVPSHFMKVATGDGPNELYVFSIWSNDL